MNNHIVKRNNFTSIALSLAIVLAGIVITFFGFQYAKGFGSILIISGIISLSLCKKTLVHSSTGYKMLSYTYFFPKIEKERIKNMCENRDFDKLKSITHIFHTNTKHAPLCTSTRVKMLRDYPTTSELYLCR